MPIFFSYAWLNSHPYYFHLLTNLTEVLNYYHSKFFNSEWSTKTSLSLKCVLADNPQRGALLNMHIHSGTFGCHRYQNECRTRSSGHGRFYPIPGSSIQSGSELLVSAIRCEIEWGNVSSGFKGICAGFSALDRIIGFDLIKNALCEYMCKVPFGVVKHFVCVLIH